MLVLVSRIRPRTWERAFVGSRNHPGSTHQLYDVFNRTWSVGDFEASVQKPGGVTELSIEFT